MTTQTIMMKIISLAIFALIFCDFGCLTTTTTKLQLPSSAQQTSANPTSTTTTNCNNDPITKKDDYMDKLAFLRIILQQQQQQRLRIRSTFERTTKSTEYNKLQLQQRSLRLRRSPESPGSLRSQKIRRSLSA